MSTRSDSIKEIGTALAKAQAVLVGAVKDSVNPHFRNKYADLASCWDACRKALTSNGIAVVQMPEKDMIGYYVETLLTHSSGEWMVKQRSTKEEVESQVQTPILGNGKTAVKWEGQ